MNSDFIKCVVIGDGAVGKTTLLHAYIFKNFCDSKTIIERDYVPTIFDNFTASLVVQNRVINLSLWDTAGQEGYDRLRPLSYLNTDVLLVCYSIISETSLINIVEKWLPEVTHYCPNVPYLIVGLKYDLLNDDKIMARIHEYNSSHHLLTKERVDQYLISNNIETNRHIVASALTGYNIDEIFNTAVNIALENHQLQYRNKNKIKKSGCILL